MVVPISTHHSLVLDVQSCLIWCLLMARGDKLIHMTFNFPHLNRWNRLEAWSCFVVSCWFVMIPTFSSVLPLQGIDHSFCCSFGQIGTAIGVHWTTDVHNDDQIFGSGGARGIPESITKNPGRFSVFGQHLPITEMFCLCFVSKCLYSVFSWVSFLWFWWSLYLLHSVLHSSSHLPRPLPSFFHCFPGIHQDHWSPNHATNRSPRSAEIPRPKTRVIARVWAPIHCWPAQITSRFMIWEIDIAYTLLRISLLTLALMSQQYLVTWFTWSCHSKW